MVTPLVLMICAVAAADASAAAPNMSEGAASQSASPAPPAAPLQVVVQATHSPSTTAMSAATPDPSSSDKSAAATQADSATTSAAPVNKAPVVTNPGKKILVDDTVNDAQLKQILARGYRPESQRHGNEVSYCRVEQELGSRFEKKICKSAAQILQDELAGKDEANRIERTGGNRALTGGP